MKRSDPITLKLRLAGYEFRSPSLSMRTRLDYISSRINNPDTAFKIRSSDVIAGDRDKRGWDTDIHAVSAAKLRGGTIVPYNSTLLESTEFGREHIDLQIAGFRLPKEQGKRMSHATLIKLVTERVAGRASALPHHKDYNSFVIDVLSGAFPIIPNQTDLRNKELELIYKGLLVTSGPRPEIDDFFRNFNDDIIADEDRLFKLFLEGGFSDAIPMDTTILQKLVFAMAILSPFEQEIISRRYGIGQDTIDTQKAIANDHNLSSSAIRKYESNILLFFRRLNYDKK